MPNHVTNRITADATVLASIASAIKGSEQTVDFERLIPMPADIPREDLTMYEQESSKGRNWYEWRIANWGTKWNAYRSVTSAALIQFETAWNTPVGIIHALAKMGLGAWRWDYADEDAGSNCGSYLCDADGKVTHVSPGEPFKFAADILGCTYREATDA